MLTVSIGWVKKKVIINVRHVALNSVCLKILLITEIIRDIEDLGVAGNNCKAETSKFESINNSAIDYVLITFGW
jgi:hypothetical protein